MRGGEKAAMRLGETALGSRTQAQEFVVMEEDQVWKNSFHLSVRTKAADAVAQQCQSCGLDDLARKMICDRTSRSTFPRESKVLAPAPADRLDE